MITSSRRSKFGYTSFQIRGVPCTIRSRLAGGGGFSDSDLACRDRICCIGTKRNLVA